MKTRILESSRIGILLLAIALPPSALATPGSAPVESQVQLALERMFFRIHSMSEKDFSRLLLPETAAVVAGIREIRELLTRATGDEPMSELSRPLAMVRTVSTEGSDRAAACVDLVRFGSVNNIRLAAYNVTLAKTGQGWRLTSLSGAGSCLNSAGYPLLVAAPQPHPAK